MTQPAKSYRIPRAGESLAPVMQPIIEQERLGWAVIARLKCGHSEELPNGKVPPGGFVACYQCLRGWNLGRGAAR